MKYLYIRCVSNMWHFKQTWASESFPYILMLLTSYWWAWGLYGENIAWGFDGTDWAALPRSVWSRHRVIFSHFIPGFLCPVATFLLVDKPVNFFLTVVHILAISARCFKNSCILSIILVTGNLQETNGSKWSNQSLWFHQKLHQPYNKVNILDTVFISFSIPAMHSSSGRQRINVLIPEIVGKIVWCLIPSLWYFISVFHLTWPAKH